MQLHALLDSIEFYAPHLYGCISVILCATEPEYEEGYRVLAGRKPLPEFYTQEDFSRDLFRLCTESNFEYISFATDDTIFYRNVSPEPMLRALCRWPGCFSLRLGQNITWCWNRSVPESQPQFRRTLNTLRWKYCDVSGEFGNQDSIDGNVYPIGPIVELLQDAHVPNPNHFEDAIQYARLGRWMTSFRHSVLVGLPLNRVSNTHGTRSRRDQCLSAESLNRRYLENQIIDIHGLSLEDTRSPTRAARMGFHKFT